MRKITSALAAFILLITMAFLPTTAAAKVPNLLTSPKSKLFNRVDQCLVCGYALEDPSDNTGVPGVKIQVINAVTFEYYETYTDTQGYYQGGITLDNDWIIQAVQGTPSSGYNWHVYNSTANYYNGANCGFGQTGTILWRPFYNN